MLIAGRGDARPRCQPTRHAIQRLAFVIGVTVVGFGTSAPELAASLPAATTGHDGMAVGNVIGSNIMNIALVLGSPR